MWNYNFWACSDDIFHNRWIFLCVLIDNFFHHNFQKNAHFSHVWHYNFLSFYKSHFGNACIYQTFSKHIYNVIWNIYFKIVSLLGSPQLLSYVTLRKKKWITLYPWNSGAVIRWLSWKLPQMTSRHWLNRQRYFYIKLIY